VKILTAVDEEVTIKTMQGTGLTLRQQYGILLYVAATKGNAFFNGKRSQLAKKWRFKTQTYLMELINDKEKLRRAELILSTTLKIKDTIDQYTAPIEFKDLIGENTIERVAGEENQTKKSTANEKHRYGLRYELISVFISEKLDFISVSISE
jgi:hypothetical protein